eukprot:SAG22_NODE_7104_length_776_cov_0.872969_2_plen_118_part_01
MDSVIGFWFLRSPHYANGSHGEAGSNVYSSWIISSALQRAKVTGNTTQLTTLLPSFAAWWEGKANGGFGPMWRMDCLMDKNNFPKCLSVPPSESKIPQCWGILDGWDAMEGSVSGGGC